MPATSRQALSAFFAGAFFTTVFFFGGAFFTTGFGFAGTTFAGSGAGAVVVADFVFVFSAVPPPVGAAASGAVASVDWRAGPGRFGWLGMRVS